MKQDAYPTLYRRVNSKWMKDSNARPEVTELLEENILGKLLDIDGSSPLICVRSKYSTANSTFTQV